MGDATRTDNSLTVIELRASDFVIDGCTITGGYSSITGGSDTRESFGAAIYTNTPDAGATITNCIIEKNLAYNGGAGIFVQPNSGITNFTLESCIIRDNYSRYGTGLWFMAGVTATSNLIISNSLFYNNLSGSTSDSSGTFFAGGAGSSMWLRTLNSASTVSAFIVNTSFIDNKELGNGFTVPNSNRRSTIWTTNINSSDPSKLSLTVSNSDFNNNTWLNGGINSVTSPIGDVLQSTVNGGNSNIIVDNSIDVNGFVEITNKTNIISTAATYVNATSQDFSPAAGSSAIDAGNNNSIFSSSNLDLNGNTRIVNTTVDIGAYEYNTTTPTYDLTTTVVGLGTVTPASGTTFNQGDTANLVATPATGWQFDGWSGDLTSTNANESLLMDANKSVTATFSLITYTVTVTVVGQGSYSLPGSGVFLPGGLTSITAIPDSGYQFVGWSGDITSTQNPLQLQVTSDFNITATFSTTAGLEDRKAFDFIVYPNPVQDAIKIDGEFAFAKAELYNLQGQLLKTYFSKEIDVKNLTSGIYIIKAIDQSDKVSTQQFIKK
ncbi:hypothetical protein JCM19275_941 [Nonlabens ulvanivorans]|uniref:Uncharacterized protein n=1 Tax=Nonlabens ulvanivorans TaxID=906888 RepID=A0A090X2U7_NONUL|nr:T9SS type A sorting domain-containing protein [Nonlabens ulvanivorans]GAL74902.1 hypothetical protein JCM19275_941 [Nonlabens ulvanivorans]